MLRVSRHGVRHLVALGELRPSEEPTTGQWLFWPTEVVELAERRARLGLRARGEIWRALRLVARTAEPRQLALPLWGEGRRKVTTPLRSNPGRFAGETPVGLISTVTDTRGARRRMAKADLHDRHDARRATGR